jgi:RNA polymerase sigma-70 factor (ECF subfamily)
MIMRDVALPPIAQLEAGTADDTFQMDEDTFRAFYDRTARGVWAYLSRTSGDRRVADDLLQETYYRFLKIGGTYESDAHQRNYLFRIATNLVHDMRRKRRVEPVDAVDEVEAAAVESGGDVAAAAARRIDLSRAMARLKPRERDLLWLAYAQGSSHAEIAQALGLKASSIKGLLFRAQKQLAKLLTSRSGQ